MKKDIAIIGISGRFPKSASVRELWDNLYGGRELIHFFSEKELEEKGVPQSDRQHPDFVRAGSFVSDTDKFDYPLFRYTVHEAGIMDPQTRLMHQLVWEALEDAGCTPETYHKKTGIFMGANKNLAWSVYATVTPVAHVDDMTKRKLSNPNFMASLIAYKFNFKGPCYFIDTACSTSLSTAHLACRSLLLNECGIAVVGGARLSSDEEKGYLHQEGGITSRDGHNKTFDSTSSGTIACDAAGVVVLKRLEDALQDGDDIYAVIKGSAMNNDGSEKGGYTMPSIQGQAECIRLAHKIAGVSPADITYVEAHGTATRIGDPIEVEALNIAFNHDTTHKCALSTIKSNMGHADEAAGVSGLIKTTLAIHHRTIPASLHFNQANPAVNFAGGPFYVNAATAPWSGREGSPLTAGVSSFGIGGTNVHMVLQEAPVVNRHTQDSGHQVFRISAASPEALERYEKRLQDFLRENPAADVNSIAYTLQTGRRSLDYRKYLVASSVEGLTKQLPSGAKTHAVTPGHHMVFMFSGQGAQYVNMGRELYDKYPAFREQLDKGLDLLHQYNNIDYKAVLFHDLDDKRLHDTLYTQPLLFVLEHALAKWLMQLGVRPDYMIGHSLGEYVAATISGVFGFEDAVRLICARAALMSAAEAGEMLSVAAPLSRLEKDLLATVAVAAVNTQDSCVLSGTRENIAVVKEKLAQTGISAISLQTSHAFHSPMMEPVIVPFKAALAQVKMNTPEIPFVSNVSGKIITAEQAVSPDYWCEHLLSTVYFERGLQTLLELDRPVFVEIGPGRTLASFLNRAKGPAGEAAVLTTIRHQKDQVADTQHFAGFLGNLWVNGYDIDWNIFYGDNRPLKLHLPTYAFEPLVVTSKVTLSDTLLQHQGPAAKTLSDAFYMPAWKHVPMPATKGAEEHILFFNDGSLAASQLLKSLVAAGHEVTAVLKSTSFDTSIPGHIFIDTASEGCMDHLLEHLPPQTAETVNIVYAWPLSLHAGHREDYQLLLELLKVCRDVNARFTFLSDRNFQVSGNEAAGNLQQHTAALLQVAAQENPAFSATVIDIDTTTLTEKDIQLIQQEIARVPAAEKVAIRYGRRWELRFEALAKAADMPAILPQQGVCVIAGNLDELVYSLAEILQTDYAAKVVICTDSHTSVPKSYDQLKRLPGVAQIRQFDLTDTDSWLAAVAAIENEFGSINGLIHAARYNGDITLVNDITLTGMVHHFEARVDVLQTLLRVFRNRQLDFIRVFSTLSAFAGGISYGLYASAAALMDALALQEHPGVPQPVVINPDRLHKDAPWIQYADLREILHISFVYPELRQVVVSKREVNRLASRPEEEEKPKNHAAINRRHLDTGFKAPQSPTEIKIAGMMEDIFGATGIGADDDFFEMGGDSLKALMLINRIRRETGADIAIQEMFENKTTASLASLTDERLRLSQEGNAVAATTQDTLIPVLPPGDAGYPLSSSQYRLWMLDQLENGLAAYNIHRQVELNGDYDVKAFTRAVYALLDRHEILRTSFRKDAAHQVRQWITPTEELDFHITTVDLRGENDPMVAARELIAADVNQPFDLENAPLLRAALLQVEDHRYIFHYNMHHIISDGWSLGVIANDVITFYQAFVQGADPALEPLRVQYRDYASWQLAELNSGKAATSQQYWKNLLQGELPLVDFPSTLARPAIKTQRGHTIECYLPADLTRQLKSFAREHDGSLFIVLLALWETLVYRYTGLEDVVTGSAVSGRNHADMENQIGFFVNTIVFRNQPDPRAGFLQHFRQVKSQALQSYAHQSYPFDRVVEDLNPKRQLNRNALFDILLVLQNTGKKQELTQFTPDTTQFYDRGNTPAKLDMELNFGEIGDYLSFSINYHPEVYDAALIQSIMRHFSTLASACMQTPEMPLGQLPLIAPAEMALLERFNDTAVVYPQAGSVVDLFLQQVQQLPENIAVRFKDSALTYRELDQASNRFAGYLQQYFQVQAGALVGLCLYRSEWMLVAIMGILKAGAAYVPFDPDQPEERLAFLKQDSGIRVCIDQQQLEHFLHLLHDLPTTAVHIRTGDHDNAYAIYTSGSTGQPKGVLNHHAGLRNRLIWMQEYLRLSPADVVLQKTPYTFDVSVWELLLPVISGATLVFALPDGHKDPYYLQEVIAQYGITVLHFVPSMLHLFIASLGARPLSSVKHVVCSGEALPGKVVSEFRKKMPARIHNLYGPTEAAIDVTATDLTDADTTHQVSIGFPIANTRIYIVNDAMQLQPPGIAGELLIGGIQVAKGYLNRPELTAARFIDDPFVPGGRLYKTGDIARWNSDGSIAYLGRADGQVKIRGNRIELGEITAQLLANPSVTDAVVSVYTKDGLEKELVAYVVSAEEQNATALRKYLQSKLPEYEIPAWFIQLDALPLSANGKIDFKQLPPPVHALKTATAYVAPENDTESRLAEIFAVVLDRPAGEIGTHDNFFDLGANSMKLIRVLELIRQELGVDIKPVYLFQYTTIHDLATCLFQQTKPEGEMEDTLISDEIDSIIDLM